MPLSALLVGAILEVMIARPPRPESLLIGADVPAAYVDAPSIKAARDAGAFDDKAAAALLDPALSQDVRLATACAYAARFAFEPLADEYAQLAYKMPLAKISLASLRGDELLVLGVLVSGSAGQKPERAIPFFEAARKKLPQSFTAALGLAMARAQVAFERRDTCAPYRLAVDVLRDPKLVVDLRQSAIDAVFDHVSNFRESCPRRGVR